MDILSDARIAKELTKLDFAWTAIGNDYLVRTYKTKSFAESVALIKQIAIVVQKLHHDPEISLTSGQIEVRLSTHEVAGITEKDFSLAAELDGAMS